MAHKSEAFNVKHLVVYSATYWNGTVLQLNVTYEGKAISVQHMKTSMGE